ncbi:MAG TPA: hypothetical protein VGO78_09770 [Acidimicrobiales bacterium]|nr:hypothetical protein [Acidimicrobiales bacterium]
MLLSCSGRRALGGVAGAVLLLLPLACSGDDDDATAAGADDATRVLDEPSTTAPAAPDGAGVPADPCAVTGQALTALGWTATETEVVDGPGGPHSQCTWEGHDAGDSFRNGWTMFIPTSQIGVEYHEDEAIDGVGTEAFRGSPQSGEILVTGAAVPFRIWVTGGADNDADAVTLASATIDAT